MKTKKQPPVTFGSRLRLAREARGWTQQQLAVAAELSMSSVSKIEAGPRTPHLFTIRALAGALGVEIAALVGD